MAQITRIQSSSDSLWQKIKFERGTFFGGFPTKTDPMKAPQPLYIVHQEGEMLVVVEIHLKVSEQL